MFGFDLEMKCLDKVVKYRAQMLRTEFDADERDVLEVERYRLLSHLISEFISPSDVPALTVEFSSCLFSRDELAKMFASGKSRPAARCLISSWHLSCRMLRFPGEKSGSLFPRAGRLSSA